MDKTLGIIIAASILALLTAILLPTMIGSLTDTGESANELEQNTACQVQAREAQRSGNPSLVDERCLDYIDQSSFKTEAEQAKVSCILSGTC